MTKISRFYTGKILNDFVCPWCNDKRRRGMVFQNRIRWMVRMYCGHMKVLGYVAPAEWLIKNGLANASQSEDPRVKARAEHDMDIRMREARERAKYNADKQSSTLNEKYITF